MKMRYTDDGEPGIAVAARENIGTMFAALYGRLTHHTWLDAVQDADDAYSSFYQRSVEMGWHDDRSAGGDAMSHMDRAAGLWAMNDAGWDHPRAAPDSGLVAWFQVDVSPVAADRPLPVQAMLQCAEDVTRHAGVLELNGVQLLLPVQGLDPSKRPTSSPIPSLNTASWHRGYDPDGSEAVRISVNSGRCALITSVAEDLVNQVKELSVDIFTCQAHRLAATADVFHPPFGDRFWDGPAEYGITMDGRLANWSCGPIGWLAEVIADSAAQLDFRRPLVLTAIRSSRPSPTEIAA